MPFISKSTLQEALIRTRGTANHLLKIWFVLKAMGLKDNNSIAIDTSNSTDALNMLFSYGNPQGNFFIPFAHTTRFMKMEKDASRSVIQTTLQRWGSSKSVVTSDPTTYLSIAKSDSRYLLVSKSKIYPLGLGHGPSGFALDENTRVSIPDLSFAIWLSRNSEISSDDPKSELLDSMNSILNLDNTESELIFVKDDFDLQLQDTPLTDNEIYDICTDIINNTNSTQIKKYDESTVTYKRRIQRMVSVIDSPTWLKKDPEEQLNNLLQSGERSILLYGPPRTGKTRIIDNIIGRDSDERVSIQLHEGWTYENLVIGLQPEIDSERFIWKDGPLKTAIDQKKKYIILEEVNRTRVSQVLGEIFSLIEPAYRGENNKISLPNGDTIWIDNDVHFLFTMNTLDEHTEDVDDALLGRLACVEFPPRIEDLNTILDLKQLPDDLSNKIKDVYNIILNFYPLGHGYFAGLTQSSDFLAYYVSHIRPTLQNHFQSSRKEILDQIDNAIDGVFNS